MSQDSEENSMNNIKVICRFRPLNEQEKLLTSEPFVKFFEDSQTLSMTSQDDQTGPQFFKFDHVFPSDSSQEDVYNISAKPIIESVLEGFNGTILAYGQTGSGKTYTMFGLNLEENKTFGIVPRLVETLFEKIEKAADHIEFNLKVGYFEIYLEKIKDLLNPSNDNLKVHESSTRGVYVSDLTEESIISDSEIYNLMKIGTENRKVGATNMNENSSRSHSIFLLTITQTNLIDFSAKTGKLYLVDLAGSEKVGKTGAKGKRLEEAKNINKSLSILGLVITALTDSKSSHVPYRDSKLTRVLQDSLGGNSKTTLIITCSPSAFNQHETISTLRFGIRAKAIKNKPKINREFTVTELKVLLAKAQEEIIAKNKTILSFQKNIEKHGINYSSSLNDLDQHEAVFNDFCSEIKSKELYNEALAELEELKIQLEKKTENAAKLVQENQNLVGEASQMKKEAEFFYSQIQDLQQKLTEANKEIIRVKEENTNLSSALSIMKAEFLNTSKKNALLEQQIVTKTIDFSEVRYQLSLKMLNTQISQLKNDLENEQKKNAELLKEIEKNDVTIRNLIVQSTQDNKFKLLEESYKAEKNKWEETKSIFFTKFEEQSKFSDELEAELEKEQKKYFELETLLTEDQKTIKKRLDSLSRSIENLRIIYHQLANQKSIIEVEKKINDKKVLRLAEKLKNLENEKENLSKNFEQAEEENKKLTRQINEIKNSGLQEKLLRMQKLKKTIIGGTTFHGRHRRRTSTEIEKNKKEIKNYDE